MADKETWWYIRYYIANEEQWEEAFYRPADADSGDIVQEALDLHNMTWHDLKGEGTEDKMVEFYIQDGDSWRTGIHVVI